jgi:hypothetical protein
VTKPRSRIPFRFPPPRRAALPVAQCRSRCTARSPRRSACPTTHRISSYNLFIIQRTKIRSKEKLPVGKVKIEVETAYVVPKPAGPLKVTMKVNGKGVADGTVPVSAPLLFTANDCLDIGIALGSPVSLDYSDKAPFKFNGTIGQVHVQYVAAK